MSTLPFFKILHEETKPVGNFGRGTHYSVMRVPIWQDKWLKSQSHGAMLDFAIIWDEDHDERVLAVIEEIYFAGLLAPVRFIGERKGTLSVLIDAETAWVWKPAALKKYREAIGAISNNQNDPWPAIVTSLESHVFSPVNRPSSLDLREPSIIHEDLEKVSVYLQNIDMLWNVGIKPHALQTDAGDAELEAYLASSAIPPRSAGHAMDDSDPEDMIPF